MIKIMKNGDDEDKFKRMIKITTLFIDIGEVLLTNGWDHHARQRAAENFKLEWEEMESRHILNFATFEEGKLTLEEYLNRTVFYDERSFTRDQFKEFMFTQSQPYPEMIALIRKLKAKYGLKVVVISNEARELNSHRIQKFRLYEFVDCFISSCFVHLRKPDTDIFQLALDIAQTPTEQIVYIENTPMFVQIAQKMGIQSILHMDYQSTSAQLSSFSLQNDGGRYP